MADPSPKVSVLWVCTLHGLDPAQPLRGRGEMQTPPGKLLLERKILMWMRLVSQPGLLGYQGLSCPVKGAVRFQEPGAGSRDRPGDVGGFF